MKYTSLLNKILSENDVVIACHQGSAGGNIVYNTYNAMLNAINQGAHIVEFDISRTSDGIFYVFHEGEEPIRFNNSNMFRTLTTSQIKDQTLLI